MALSVDSLSKSLASTDLGEAVLTFKNQSLKLNTANDAEEIAQAIESAENVDVLELGGNTIGVEAGKRLETALSKRQDLKRALWSDIFRTRLKTEIPEILRCLWGGVSAAGAHLTELDLADNALGPVAIPGLEGFFRTPSSYSLRVLNLNNCGLGISGKIIAKCLIDCHRLSTDAGRPLQLKTFIAGRNRLENPCAIALAEAFSVIGTLETIEIPQNGIYPAGIKALATSFEKNKGLKHINISDNTCRVEGALEIAEVLSQLQQIEILNFADCLMRGKGGVALARAIAGGLPMLQKLLASGNEFPAHVAEKLITAVKGKEQIDTVDLAYNSFGTKFDQIGKLISDTGIKNVSVGDEDDNEDSPSETEATEDELSEEEEEVEEGALSNTTIWTSAREDGTPGQKHECLLDDLTVERLLRSTSAAEQLLAEMSDEVDNPDAVTRVIVRLGQLFDQENTDQLLPVAAQCSALLLDEAIEKRTGALSVESQIINCLVAQLGFIKTETKSSEKPKNISGVLLLLGELINRGYFAKNVDALVYWLQKPSPALSPWGDFVDSFVRQVEGGTGTTLATGRLA